MDVQAISIHYLYAEIDIVRLFVQAIFDISIHYLYAEIDVNENTLSV